MKDIISLIIISFMGYLLISFIIEIYKDTTKVYYANLNDSRIKVFYRCIEKFGYILKDNCKYISHYNKDF